MSDIGKPLIGVALPERPEGLTFTDNEYIRSIEETGGVPAVINRDWKEMLPQLGGILLTGGKDIAPCHYGEENRYPEGILQLEPERDSWGLPLAREALRAQVPLLAICRGLQELNVVAGGTLHQHLPQECPWCIAEHRGPVSRETRHPVEVLDGDTILFEVLGTTDLVVNSRHHQAVKELAPFFRLTARSADGVVEAFEGVSHPWLLAVQWHPESGEVFDAFRPLFESFVERARVGKRS
ncbi:MAG: gamma-glutamyl-gamma-aminobutyrate hydrolase family protein [Armatimonadetes bacterium]|nr:gamma-glutamyl-gamma-aminobutyrate hydrolase family protein [Armatimonadota bacterium]